MIAWWSEKYEIGIKEVDEQHKDIIDMLNRMHDALPKKNAVDDVIETITALAIYTKLHFKTEEAAMAEIGYPYLERQRKQHATLNQKVHGMVMKMNRGDVPSVRETLAFLKQWLLDHIEKEDMLIKKFLQSRKAPAKKQVPAKAKTPSPAG